MLLTFCLRPKGPRCVKHVWQHQSAGSIWSNQTSWPAAMRAASKWVQTTNSLCSMCCFKQKDFFPTLNLGGLEASSLSMLWPRRFEKPIEELRWYLQQASTLSSKCCPSKMPSSEKARRNMLLLKSPAPALRNCSYFSLAHLGLRSSLRRQESSKKLKQCLSKTRSQNQGRKTGRFPVTRERTLKVASMLSIFLPVALQSVSSAVKHVLTMLGL